MKEMLMGLMYYSEGKSKIGSSSIGVCNDSDTALTKTLTITTPTEAFSGIVAGNMIFEKQGAEYIEVNLCIPIK